MIYTENIRIPSSDKKVKHIVARCVKCGKDDITISEYEDQFGFISTATCKSCDNKVKVNAGIAAVIKEWNNKNDIPTLIKIKKKLIINTEKEIERLTKLQAKRKNA